MRLVFWRGLPSRFECRRMAIGDGVLGSVGAAVVIFARVDVLPDTQSRGARVRSLLESIWQR